MGKSTTVRSLLLLLFVPNHFAGFQWQGPQEANGGPLFSASGSVATRFQRQLAGPDQPSRQKSSKVKFSWPSTHAVETSPSENARIGNEIFRHGKMKNCYKLSMGEEQFVAKRFFEIGRGKNQARWFLKNFHNSADVINLVGNCEK
ncbi:hypothetical protein B0H14DRAFT_2603731 [Mycena olivaceomarginata]|nr:hypothetical protein B0H14DRAFT_2603731 [Mycena olivaceomarginata]